MRVTGWTVDELRAAPARVVRAHFTRIFAGLLYDPELARAAASPAAPRSAFGSLAEYATARNAQRTAITAQQAIEAVLWPEDSDG